MFPATRVYFREIGVPGARWFMMKGRRQSVLTGGWGYYFFRNKSSWRVKPCCLYEVREDENSNPSSFIYVVIAGEPVVPAFNLGCTRIKGACIQVTGYCLNGLQLLQHIAVNNRLNAQDK